MEQPEYLLVGHITADLTPQGRLLGGTVSYAARTARACGLRVGVVTSAAPDEPLLSELSPYAHLECQPAPSTSTFENVYTPAGRVQYVRGAALPLTEAHIPPAWKAAPLVHLAPLTGEIDPRLAAVFPNATVMLTLQGLLRRWDASGRVHFKRLRDLGALEQIDLVVLSEEDIAEAPDLERELIAHTRHLVITRAERGGTYYHAGQVFEYSTPGVKLVHPTGAGDVFAAALLASLRHFGGDIKAALQLAAHLGALSVTRVGLAGAPTPREVQHMLARMKNREA